MTIFHLLTPGENSWSKKQRIVGTRDISLTQKGIKQGVKCAQALKKYPIQEIFTSRSTFARQYANLIQEELCRDNIRKARLLALSQQKTRDKRAAYLSVHKRNQLAPIKITRDNRLNNLHMGYWEGKYPEEVEARSPVQWHTWNQSPLDLTFDAGDIVAQRHKQWLEFLNTQFRDGLFEEHIVVITHEFQTASLLCTIENLNPSQINTIKIPDASHLIVEYNKADGYSLRQILHSYELI